MIRKSPIRPGTVWLCDMLGHRSEDVFLSSDEARVDDLSLHQAGVGSVCRRPSDGGGWEYGIALVALNDPGAYGSREMLQADAVKPSLEERLPGLLQDFEGLEIGLGTAPGGGAILGAFVPYGSPLLDRIDEIDQAMNDIAEHCFGQAGTSASPGM